MYTTCFMRPHSSGRRKRLRSLTGGAAAASILMTLGLALAAGGIRPPSPWGPLRSEHCGRDGYRVVSAEFLNPDHLPNALAACEKTTRNVMGRNAAPSRCKASGWSWLFRARLRGEWETPDARCHYKPQQLPRETVTGSSPVDGPLEGFADIHVHQMGNLGFGGSIVWGSAYGRPETALASIPEQFRRGHEVVQGAVTGRPAQVIFHGRLDRQWHGEQGYPSFTDWPRARIWTHQQVYEDWLFRAYRGGLRLMVMLAANSEDMFGRGENSLPRFLRNRRFQEPLPGRSGNDMEALEWQVRDAYRMQTSIDTRYGGRGKGWYRIVRDPREADEVLSEGKLAVVLGTELQHLFNCDLDRPDCSRDAIVEGLNKLEAMGVSYVFPVHHKQNQFAGPAMFQPLNAGGTEDCRDLAHECSAVGLTALGKFLIHELMARGMLIDTEHLSRKAFDEMMTLAERWSYPVLGGHVVPLDMQDGSAQNERARTSEQLRRIFRVGGMVAPILSVSSGEYAVSSKSVPIKCDDPQHGGGADQWANAYLYLKDLAAAEHAAPGSIALGADWNGFAGWPGPRFDGPDRCIARKTRTGIEIPKEPRVTYPFVLPSRLVPSAAEPVRSLNLMEWPSGIRRWDYNAVGVAHVGLIPDFLQNLRTLGVTEADVEPIYRSARQLVTLWKRARALNVENDRHSVRWVPASPFDVLAFEEHEAARDVEVTAGHVICASRDARILGYVRNDSCQPVSQTSTPTPKEVDRRMVVYHAGRCLDVDPRRSATWYAVQRTCGSHVAQQWELLPLGDGRLQIRNVANGRCLAAPQGGSDTRARVQLTTCDTDLRLLWTGVRTGNTFRLRTAGDLCLEIPRDSRKENVAAQLVPCTGASNQQWSIEALRRDDYLRLYQSDQGRVQWSSAADPLYLEPVTLGDSAICRSADAVQWLGLIDGITCVGTDFAGRPANTRTFEQLYQAR